ITMDTDPVPTGSVPIAIEDDETFDTSASGTFTQSIIIPSLEIGDYGITVNDGVKTATFGFEVLGISELEVEPELTTPGASVTISGYNYSQIAGSTLTFTIGGSAVPDSITVDADGTFEGMVIVPALPLGELHELTVIDENGLNARFDLLFNHYVLLLSEYQGYSGEEVQITASGLRGTGLFDDKFDIWFGNEAIYTGIPATQTNIAESFTVPDVPPGIYEVTITDHGWGYNISTDFQVVREISEDYWYVDLHIQSGLDYSDITCGVIQTGTSGFDPNLGDVIVFPAPPEGVFAFFNNINDPNIGIDTSRLLSTFHAPEYPDNWTFEVGLIGISGETSITWSSIPVQAIPVGYSILLTTPEGYLDMQQVNEYIWTGETGETYSFKILVSEIQTQTISLVTGWNLVSFSLELLTPSVEMALDSLGYSQIYRWNGASYVSVDTLEVGVGYWILVLQNAELEVSGYSLGSYTYVLETGWNLVGGYDIVPVDLDTHLSGYYQMASWSGHGYDMSSSIIQPFKGYWILVIEHTEFNAP
ncbi:hypothetical protein HOD41_06000, partial [bacterium]|nr:hypothetical protein [bacterium]